MAFKQCDDELKKSVVKMSDNEHEKLKSLLVKAEEGKEAYFLHYYKNEMYRFVFDFAISYCTITIDTKSM